MAGISDKPGRAGSNENDKVRSQSDGRGVARTSKVTRLKRTTEVVGHRDGGDLSTR